MSLYIRAWYCAGDFVAPSLFHGACVQVKPHIPTNIYIYIYGCGPYAWPGIVAWNVCMCVCVRRYIQTQAGSVATLLKIVDEAPQAVHRRGGSSVACSNSRVCYPIVVVLCTLQRSSARQQFQWGMSSHSNVFAVHGL